MSDLTSVLGRLLSWVLTVLCAAYLLRVPLLTGLGVIVLYWAALFSPAKPLLGNGLDVGTFSGLVYVSLTAVLLAWVIMVTGRLVRLHGIERFFGAASSRTDRIAPYIKWLRLLYYYALIPINLVAVIGAVAGATYTSERLGWPLALGAGALGLLLFLPFAVAVHLVELLFARPVVLRNEPSDVFLPTAGEPDDAREHDTGDEPEGQTPRPQSLRQFEQLVRGSDPASRLMRRPWVAWLVRRLRALSRLFPENVGRGYFEYRDGEVAWIRRGHMGALALFALTLVFYALLGARDFLRLTIGEPPLVPTLCYILLLATLFCWGFSGYAFFLDRYRIPVFIPLVALLLVTSYAPWLESDYYYPTTEPVQEIEGEPSSDDSMVVVATTGGGIQSAAWTARVLTGLEHKCRRECAQSFGESIRLISSVSGGSVGTMYFVNEYSGGRLPDKDAELEEIVTRTERSSLDHVVWGLLYPDLVRLFNVLPIKLGWDRGRALEQAWLREDAAWEGREGVRVGLSEWRNDARVGDRPAVIFNTTIAENGRRLALTTTEPLAGRLRHDELLPRGEPATDISVVTATRLSASFPYVSPAARADVEGAAPHIVDGGYYDNYGITSLVEWLDDELERNPEVRRVLVVEIRGSGEDCTSEEGKVGSKEGTGTQDPITKRGWLYQAHAPLSTVLNVRGTAQEGNNEVALRLLEDKWDQDGVPRRVRVERSLFSFDGADVPTSWHLTDDQKNRIQEKWEEELTESCNTQGGWQVVKDFLGTSAEGN